MDQAALLPPLLSLPCELRNAIYHYIFAPEQPHLHLSLLNHNNKSGSNTNATSIAGILKPLYDHDDFLLTTSRIRHLSVLLTCKQIHAEAQLLAVSMTSFYVVADAAHPDHFSREIAHLRPVKVQAIRDITLTARIPKLRALNEAWCGLPFGHTSLHLDQLTIVPKRPDANYSAYAEIAYHSQAHILAHLLSETFKGLRNVRVVQVKNQGCFNDFFWELMYKSIIFRMWNWSGHSCGVRFAEGKGGGETGGQWFKAWLQDGSPGNEVGDEMKRFLGNAADIQEPAVFGF